MSERSHAAVDLSNGIDASSLRDGGMIAGKLGDDEVLVARVGDEMRRSIVRHLSKDYFAGDAQDDGIPLWGNDFYEEHGIEMLLGRRVTAIDTSKKTVKLDDGSERPYDALLLATGADPVRPPIPGSDGDHVRYLRSFADSRAIVERAAKAKRVVVCGSELHRPRGGGIIARARHRGGYGCA